MIVGRRVTRQVARYEMAVLVDRAEPAPPERLTLLGREQRRSLATQQVPGTGPIDEAHPQLKRTCPMGTAGIGALLQPGRQQATCSLSKARLAREMPCLRQGHQLQVAVGLPEILDVADDALAPAIDILAETERRLNAGFGIAIPARWEAEGAIPQRKHVPPSGEKTVSRRDIQRRTKVRGQRRNPRRAAGARTRTDIARKAETPALKPGCDALPHPPANFGGRHRFQQGIWEPFHVERRKNKQIRFKPEPTFFCGEHAAKKLHAIPEAGPFQSSHQFALILT